MSEPIRRRWFQVHLSTCVVLMFAAGGILWANLEQNELLRYGLGGVVFRDREQGWPFHWYGSYGVQGEALRRADGPYVEPTYGQRTWENLQNRRLPPGLHATRFDAGIRGRAFVANLICWLAMLGVTAFVCERFTRRKKGRTAAPSAKATAPRDS